MNIILAYVKKSRLLIILAALSGIFGGVTSAAFIALVHRVTTNRGWLSPLQLLSLAALCFIVPAGRLASGHILSRLSQHALSDLRLQLSHNILRAPLRVLERLGGPRLIGALASDTQSVAFFLCTIPHICVNGSIILVCLVYLCWLSPIAFLLIVSAFCIRFWIFVRLSTTSASFFTRAREEQDRLFTLFGILVEGNKQMKLHAGRANEFFHEHLTPVCTKVAEYNTAGMSMYNLAANLGHFAVLGVLAAMSLNLRSWGGLQPDAVVGCVFVVLFMVGPVDVLTHQLSDFGQARVALGKLEALSVIESHGEGRQCNEIVGAHSRWRQLELSSVTYKYIGEDPRAPFLLGPLDLVLHPNETLFIIGDNGSGKTTLAKLITGLYEPTGGTIAIDGKALCAPDQPGYRRLFSAVFAEPFVFSSLAGLNASELHERTAAYLRAFHLAHKVKIDGTGFAPMDLSQGERKRLALVVALLEDRPIYLFDEWAAEQDPTFRDLFYHSVIPDLRAQGKTVIVITHDERYFETADRIIRVQDGGILESSPAMSAKRMLT